MNLFEPTVITIWIPTALFWAIWFGYGFLFSIATIIVTYACDVERRPLSLFVGGLIMLVGGLIMIVGIPDLIYRYKFWMRS